MLSEKTQFVNYSKESIAFDRSNHIVRELVNIFKTSPETFVYMLKLTLSNAFNLSENEGHKIIHETAREIGEETLRNVLKGIDGKKVMVLKYRPKISESALSTFSGDGFELAMVLARHSYGDMSETPSEQAAHSNRSIQDGCGIYSTTYKLGDVVIQVSTELPSYRTAIDIF